MARVGWMERLGDRRVVAAALGAGAVIVLGGSGLAAASAMQPTAETPAQGRLTVAYDVRREPRYVPPQPSEATRLDVRPPASLYQHVEVLSPEADAAWTAMQADDARRMAAALAEVRAADRRADREFAMQMRALHADDPEERPAEFVQGDQDGADSGPR